MKAPPDSEKASEKPQITHWIVTIAYESMLSIMMDRAFFERDRPE